MATRQTFRMWIGALLALTTLLYFQPVQAAEQLHIMQSGDAHFMADGYVMHSHDAHSHASDHAADHHGQQNGSDATDHDDSLHAHKYFGAQVGEVSLPAAITAATVWAYCRQPVMQEQTAPSEPGVRLERPPRVPVHI